jgi:hypothetical protein
MATQIMLFDFVPQTREDEKYFDISQNDIQRFLAKDGEFEIACDDPMEDGADADLVAQQNSQAGRSASISHK